MSPPPRQQGWRSRAAFKLLELDDKFHLIQKGARVLDLGAAPGGWTQVAVKRGAASVLAMDLLPIDPIHGAADPAGRLHRSRDAGAADGGTGRQADLVLSDMAPNTTGHAATDHIRIVALAEMALDFAVQVLAPGGAFVAKVFQGGSEKQILDRAEAEFRQRPPCQAAGQPQGIQRAVCRRDRISRTDGSAAIKAGPRPASRVVSGNPGSEP